MKVALRTPTGHGLVGNLGGRSLYVPESFYTEAAGVLRRMAAREEISGERAQQAPARPGLAGLGCHGSMFVDLAEAGQPALQRLHRLAAKWTYMQTRPARHRHQAR